MFRCGSYGKLASLTSAAEINGIQPLLNVVTETDYIWIGLDDQVTEGTYVWADGSPFSYSNWNSGEPSNSGGGAGEDCVHTYRNGLWNDVPCNILAGALLEFDCSAPIASTTYQGHRYELIAASGNGL